MNEVIMKTLEQLVLKNMGPNIVVEINNLETNNDGFNNDITMFHLDFCFETKKITKPVVLKKFSYSMNYYKELYILKNESLNKYINIPKLYFEYKENLFLLMEQVKGITLDQYLKNSANDMMLTFAKFGSTLAHIHSVNINSLNDEYIKDNAILPKNDINDYIESLKSRVRGWQDPIYINILTNIEKSFEGIKFTEVLNHGDYHFRNTMITNDHKLYILDWEKAFLGDLRFDIANTIILGYSWFGLDFKEPMLDAYQNIHREDIEHLECFEALLSFDSFTKVVPLIDGADDSHIRDRTFEWLKRRYELFVKHAGKRIEKAEEYLFSKGLTIKI